MNRYPNTDDKIIVKKIAALSGYFLWQHLNTY